MSVLADRIAAMDALFHIARRADWARAQQEGQYTVSTLGRTLAQEGFIHLSFAQQVDRVGRALYRDVPDLVVLELDPSCLPGEVRVEPVPGSDERFPHLYGAIPPSAVVVVRPIEFG